MDVLFFYDADMLLRYTKSDIKSMMIEQIEAGNSILKNSLISDFRWRFVDCYVIPEYATDYASLSSDLGIISNYSHPVGEYVEVRREQHNADQVQLWVLYTRNDGYAGIGHIGGYYSVVVPSECNLQTVTHELGHNFGCQHDRLEPGSGASDNDKKYNYAWSIKEEVKDTDGNPVLGADDKPVELYYGTIMSYASTDRFDYFSNPDIPASEIFPPYARFGNIGFPAGHPKAADNARCMRQHSLAMSTAGDAPAAPKILAHPQNVTLSTGNTATITVYASSPPRAGEVRYKWRTNTQVVQDGTSNSLMVGGGAAGTATVYYVEVSNSAGSVTSNPATVMVSAVDIPTTYSDSGGGGSPSLWYLSAIVLLIALRRPRASRKA